MEFNLKRDINKTIEMMEKVEFGEKIEAEYSKVYSTCTIDHRMLYSNMHSPFSKFLGLIGSSAPFFKCYIFRLKRFNMF